MITFGEKIKHLRNKAEPECNWSEEKKNRQIRV